MMGGPGYSPVFGGCVEGERMVVALMRYDGEWHRGGPGQVFYVPADKVHCARNEGAQDCVFFTCKDASHGLHGTRAA